MLEHVYEGGGKGTVRHVLMWHSDEWVLWLEFYFLKIIFWIIEKWVQSCEGSTNLWTDSRAKPLLGGFWGDSFGDWRNFVCWDIGCRDRATSCQRKSLLGITKCVGSWTLNNICARKPINVTLLHISHLAILNFGLVPVVTLIRWQITTALFWGRKGERWFERL